MHYGKTSNSLYPKACSPKRKAAGYRHKKRSAAKDSFFAFHFG
jgi:hypothetical protein